MERNCGQCALKALRNGMCPVFNANMEGENGCPYFTTEIHTCDICGNPIPKGGYIQEDNGEFHLMCDNCATGHPCRSCKEVRNCRFETDQDCQEPPYVMVQQRQGNMVVQTQALNPRRVQATCAAGCSCYSEEYGCMKEHGCGCNNHKFNWRK